MNVRLIVDGIVRQTTVLIAQLSTAAGVRAPLAHIADQVFLELSREIEAQGISRKVAADMFGMALRAYQKKVQRLAESATDRNRTLWLAVVEFLRDGSKTRSRVLERFQNDGEREVGAVLSDLVASGLVYCTGRGSTVMYGLSSEADRHALAAERDVRSVANVAWLDVFLGEARTEAEIANVLGVESTVAREAVALLLQDRRLTRGTDGALTASNVVIPVGSPEGWEAAVLDHFRAVATAIGKKASQAQSAPDDSIGGSTLSFNTYPGHPLDREVRALFPAIRSQVFALWDRVAAYNDLHPAPPDAATVTLYLGQMVTDPTLEDE